MLQDNKQNLQPINVDRNNEESSHNMLFGEKRSMFDSGLNSSDKKSKKIQKKN